MKMKLNQLLVKSAFSKKTVCSILAITLFTSISTPISAHSFGGLYTPKTIESSNVNQNDIESALNVIMNAPDNLLMNGTPEEIASYFSSHNIAIHKDLKMNRSIWQVAKCTGSIIWVIESTVFVGAKILKIKKYIKEIGGVTKAASLLILFFKGKGLPSGTGNKVGSALIALAGDISGVTTIKDNCF